MVDIASILVDFDGTACRDDVSEVLLDVFGDPGWPSYDEQVDRGQIGLREAMHAQVAMLHGSRVEMLAYAVEHCALDTTFVPFVEWARSRSLPLALASDGFAFYIRPILHAAGLDDVEVIANRAVFDGARRPRLEHPNGNRSCHGCGTCKMLAALGFRDRYGSVAYVGEGQSDRYGALYSDVVFAKDALPAICERDGVPFLPYEDFDDVRRALEGGTPNLGPLAPALCPGWIDPP
jgi:2-hydroxy-3-keto-5-methylthiopentenyl-1-phosphate phosphatase